MISPQGDENSEIRLRVFTNISRYVTRSSRFSPSTSPPGCVILILNIVSDLDFHPELTYSPDLTSWLHTHHTLLIYPDLLTILTYYLSWLVSDLFSLLIPLITLFFFKLIPPTAQINTTHHTFIYYPDLFLTDLFILLTYSYSWLANPPDLFLKYAFILLPYFWLIPMLAHTQHTTTTHFFYSCDLYLPDSRCHLVSS